MFFFFALYLPLTYSLQIKKLMAVEYNDDYDLPAWNLTGDPILIKSAAVFQSWNISRMNFEDFLALGPLIPEVQISDTNYFPFYDTAIINKSLYRQDFSAPYGLRQVHLSTFFSNMPSVQYYYASADLQSAPFTRVASLVDPESLVHNPVTSTLWISSKGVHTPTHYDVSNNLYVQLYGKKRIRLFPHSSAGLMCQHGRMHPHDRQSRYEDLDSQQLVKPTFSNLYLDQVALSPSCSQESIRSTTLSRCPLSLLEGWEVDLEPGNILYIPQFWFHEVQTH
jgi:hypothetical protein